MLQPTKPPGRSETNILITELGAGCHSLEDFTQDVGLLYHKDWKAGSLSEFLWGLEG